ncbi:MAG: peptide-methionine (R)-S-oxide reductase MsrB [Parcubacteria group bacterium]|jgi:peptide-methionine (R)-S-oxide reductase
MIEKITKTDEEWRAILGPERFKAMRQSGTEPAFSNVYWDNEKSGIYHCVACDLALFRSEDKFDSGTGWPSFTRPLESDHVEYKEDCSLASQPCRTAVECARCNSHLGHVFDDLLSTWRSKAGGPPSGGRRFCMNSIALNFREDKNK